MGVDIMSYKAPENAVPKPKDICFNWWTWRPIVNLIRILNETYKLDISDATITGMHANEGKGIYVTETCRQLAKHICEVIDFMKMKNHKTLFFNMGPIMFNNRSLNDDERDRFNKKYPGIFYDPVWFEGDYCTSMYNCTIDDLEAFARFLERCYGFQVH